MRGESFINSFKKVVVGGGCLALCLCSTPVAVNAADVVYFDMKNTNDSHYEFRVEATSYISSLYLVDWVEHFKGIDDKLYIEEDTSFTSTCTASISSSISASMGFEQSVPGFSSTQNMEASVEASAGIENSNTRSFKKGYEGTVRASNAHNFYALEMVQYGDALKMTWSKTPYSGGKTITKIATIKFYPEATQIPGKRLKKYTTSKLAGNYNSYKSFWKVK